MAYIKLSQGPWIEEVKKSFETINGITLTEKPLGNLENGALVYLMPFLDEAEIVQNQGRLRFVNSLDSILTSGDKMKTSQKLIEAGVRTPETFIGQNLEELRRFVQAKGLAILKERFSCGGEGHLILSSERGEIIARNETKEYVLHQGDKKRISGRDFFVPSPFYAQELILEQENFNDRVYRAYVVGEAVTFATERRNSKVRSARESIINVAKGAKYHFIPTIPEEMESLSLRTARAVGFDIGTVDLIKDAQGRFYVIEVTLDSHQMHICRKFMHAEGYNEKNNFNRQIIEKLKELE